MTRTVVSWSDSLGKRVRSGTWAEQAISTTRCIEQEIDAGRWETAAQLVDYWMEEAKVVQAIYDSWTEGWRSFLAQAGVVDSDVEDEFSRLGRLLAFPDGQAFTVEGRWLEIAESAGRLAHSMRVGRLSTVEAQELLATLVEMWRQQHDRGADLQSGLLTFTARTLGEPAIGEAYSWVLGPYLEERYKVFDVRNVPYEETLERNIYLAFEAMRGHLVGPERTGDISYTEDEEKIVLAFDPCGSGNRGQRGDPIEHTGSRSDPPYEFGTTQNEYDWAWNEKGVCYYCAHCCFALEYWPANQWGHPIRVVDSPLHPDETTGDTPRKCTWTIYKSLDAIPDEAYRRIGATKPDVAAMP